MGKVNTQQPFLCGKCKTFFTTKQAVSNHIYAKHKGHMARIYSAVEAIDLREEDEPSFADRAIAAELAIAMGDPTDDAWLLGV